MPAQSIITILDLDKTNFEKTTNLNNSYLQKALFAMSYYVVLAQRKYCNNSDADFVLLQLQVLPQK